MNYHRTTKTKSPSRSSKPSQQNYAKKYVDMTTAENFMPWFKNLSEYKRISSILDKLSDVYFKSYQMKKQGIPYIEFRKEDERGNEYEFLISLIPSRKQLFFEIYDPGKTKVYFKKLDITRDEEEKITKKFEQWYNHKYRM